MTLKATYLSVCSGIEAASVAWAPLGWKPWAVSEIDAFPSHVLHRHYGTGRPHHMPNPDAPNLTQEQRDERALAITRVANLPLRSLADGPVNLGDMTAYKEWPDATIDVLCGGTPCQSFSNAGLRAGLDDPRGQLMLTFGAIAARYRPDWLVWENVPGVLSSNGGRDFGAFLGLLGFLGYGFAYRVLDAQFVRVDGHGRAVPQRRNRVFVVGRLGDWRSAAAVLLERESLRGDPAPRRQAGARVFATLTRGAESSGKGGYAGQRQEDDVNIVAGALAGTGPGAGWRIGNDEAAANHCIAIQGTMIGRADTAGPAGSGINVSGVSLTLTKQDVHAVAMCHNAKGGAGRMDGESETLIPTNGGVFDVAPTITAQIGEQTGQDAMNGGLVAHTLRADGFDASEDGTGRGTPLVPVLPFDTTQVTSASNRANPRYGDPCHSLAKGSHAPAIAFPARMSSTQSASTEGLSPALGAVNPTAITFKAGAGSKAGSLAESEEVSPTLGACPSGNNSTPSLLTSMQVRRLTPTECERLMGFPDGYTAINWRGKPAADGPRYKALGNSWATNCARWVGRRIAIVNAMKLEAAE